MDGIEHVQSLTEAYGLFVDSTHRKIGSGYVVSRRYQRTVKKKLRLRHELKVGPSTKAFCIKGDTYMAILRIDEERLYNKQIVPVIENVKAIILAWEASTGRDLHMSGLPWIRIANSNALENRDLPHCWPYACL